MLPALVRAETCGSVSQPIVNGFRLTIRHHEIYPDGNHHPLSVASIPRRRPYCRVVAYRQQNGPTCCPLGKTAGTFCRPDQVAGASRSHLFRGQSFFGHRAGSRIRARGTVRFAACLVRAHEAMGPWHHGQPHPLAAVRSARRKTTESVAKQVSAFLRSDPAGHWAQFSGSARAKHTHNAGGSQLQLS